MNERIVLTNHRTNQKQYFISYQSLTEFLDSIPSEVFIIDHQIEINDHFRSTQKIDYHEITNTTYPDGSPIIKK